MNNNRNIYWIVAGVVNLITAILHAIGGQLELVAPLMSSSLTDQVKAEWIGGWHIITITLFLTSYVLLRNGLNRSRTKQPETIKLIGVLYVLFSLPFVVTSLAYQLLAPQWVLLLPIGVLSLIGHKKSGKHIG